MSLREVTIAGFAVLAVAAALLYLAGCSRRLGLAPLGDVLDALRSTAAVRFALVVAWAWAGWHVLAR